MTEFELSRQEQDAFDKQREEIREVFKRSELLFTNMMLLNIFEYQVKMLRFLEKKMDRMGLPKVGQHPE